MKMFLLRRRVSAFTFLELLIVLAIVLIAVGLLLPMLAKPRAVKRINCISNLKQIVLAFRIWSHDHDHQFPMAVSAQRGGSLEFNETGEVFRHFLALSNEVNTPKVLVCSWDNSRTRATNFGPRFSNSNLSYFVGADADETQPNMMLAGDRNVTGGRMTHGGIMWFDANTSAGWTKDIHNRAGNIGLADGSVSQVTEASLRRAIKDDTNQVVRLAIPLTK